MLHEINVTLIVTYSEYEVPTRIVVVDISVILCHCSYVAFDLHPNYRINH